jgi:hypothetical protein
MSWSAESVLEDVMKNASKNELFSLRISAVALSPIKFNVNSFN